VTAHTAPSATRSAADEGVTAADPDLLRMMVKAFAEALMGAGADAVYDAPYGLPNPERVNRRNGYRAREWDTRAGTVELTIPKLRAGSAGTGVVRAREPSRSRVAGI
jgi:transposase-like protein